MNRTPVLKAADLTREWYVLDASADSLGRVATVAARLLIGKHKPTYTPSMDGGDYVIIINAAKLSVTGRKESQKQYYRHSGYPGALKSRTLAEQKALDPGAVVEHAIKGMLPKNKLQAARLKRLYVYDGAEHAHSAQNPKTMEVK